MHPSNFAGSMLLKTQKVENSLLFVWWWCCVGGWVGRQGESSSCRAHSEEHDLGFFLTIPIWHKTLVPTSTECRSVDWTEMTRRYFPQTVYTRPTSRTKLSTGACLGLRLRRGRGTFSRACHARASPSTAKTAKDGPSGLTCTAEKSKAETALTFPCHSELSEMSERTKFCNPDAVCPPKKNIMLSSNVWSISIYRDVECFSSRHS